MKRLGLVLAFFVALAGAASAQGGMGPGPGTVHSIGSSYVGPGDIVSGAKQWYGLRAYSLATTGTRAARICNSGDANCADVNTLSNGDFDVATATGAPLNCGGAGGTCTVRTLYDQTTGNNCTAATCDVTNATAGTRPTLVLNCLGSLPCMAFNGTSQLLQSATGATSSAQPNTLSGVANSTNNAANQALLAFNINAIISFNTSANNTAKVFAGTNLTSAMSGGSWHSLQGVMNGASSDANIDGTSHTGNAGTGANSATIFFSSIGASQFHNGSAVEAGSWPVAFNGTQSSNMSANQHAYWGF